MQVAVRLWRKTSLYTSVVNALSEVFLYDLLNKIETFLFFNFCFHMVVILLLFLVLTDAQN